VLVTVVVEVTVETAVVVVVVVNVVVTGVYGTWKYDATQVCNLGMSMPNSGVKPRKFAYC
jgi:hypothetical protein